MHPELLRCDLAGALPPAGDAETAAQLTRDDWQTLLSHLGLTTVNDYQDEDMSNDQHMRGARERDPGRSSAVDGHTGN